MPNKNPVIPLPTSVEFTDTEVTPSYNGRALIFDTPCGSDYLGYIHHPLNNEGYRVIVTRG